MNSKIDLHMHSTASDGVDTPKELFSKVKKTGIQLFSLTDHDCIDGLDIMNSLTKDTSIKFINGVELSVKYFSPFYKDGKKGFELHILGYNIDYENIVLIEKLEELKKARIARANEVLIKLNACLKEENNSIITNEEFENLLSGIEGAVGRPHLAQLLIDKGIVSCKNEAFDKYLIKCDVAKQDLSFLDGANLIKQAGGKAVLAHPLGDKSLSLLKVGTDFNIHEKIIYSIKDMIDGIECYYWDHSDKQTQNLVNVAKKLELIITGGSDHHGGDNRERIGKLNIPDFVKDYF